MYYVYVELDQEKIEKECPDVDVQVVYNNIRKYILKPKFNMTEVSPKIFEHDNGVMFKSDDSEDQYTGIAFLTTIMGEDKWFRKYLKSLYTYDNLSSHTQEGWSKEDCLAEIDEYEKEYNISMLDWRKKYEFRQ